VHSPRSLVRGRIHHRVGLRRIAHLHLHEPAIREGGFVNHARGVVQVFVHFDDFTGDRGVHVGSRLDGLDDAEGRLRLNLGANFRKFDVHNVTQFSLSSNASRECVSLRTRIDLSSRASLSRDVARARASVRSPESASLEAPVVDAPARDR